MSFVLCLCSLLPSTLQAPTLVSSLRFVGEIVPGMAADLTGHIRLDDEVLAIDGFNVYGVSLGDIKHKLVRNVGTTSIVSVRRDGYTFDVPLKRVTGTRDIPPAYKGYYGQYQPGQPVQSSASQPFPYGARTDGSGQVRDSNPALDGYRPMHSAGGDFRRWT
mmetsp:Transcript_51353/g.102989  ORF Transcript_51353/g.102989 Transcript_51353/m.102989 type:complete len:162 (+) Transcript_51353:70-555(+)